jgi:hypothetical protein
VFVERYRAAIERGRCQACLTNGLIYPITEQNPAEGDEESAKSLSARAAESGADYKLMGMTAAFAGIMAKMGLKPSTGSGEDSSTTSGSSGIVSKRMSLLQKGDSSSVVPERPASTRAPSFVAIRTRLEQDHDMQQADEGIEVEGPFRPSSQYAI